MRIEWIESPQRLAELHDPWEELTGVAALPYLRHGWFTAWWSAYGDELRMRCCALWDGEELAGCLPAFAVRGGLQAMVNAETPLFSPPARGPGELDQLTATALEGAGTALVASAVEAGGAFAGALGRAAVRRGGRVVAGSHHTSPIVDTTGSFDDYRQRTRPKWLARLARYRRQMERRHGLELLVAERPGELEPLLSEGLRVEGSGWKAREGTAILSAPETEAFYRDVAELLWRSGELRMSMLRLEGKAVAFDLAFEHGRRLYSLKTGYDEAYKKVVPGLVLRLCLIEYCFERDLEAHELLGADMPWKRNFATSGRQHLALRCYGARLAGMAGELYHGRLRPVAAHAYRRVVGARAARVR